MIPESILLQKRKAREDIYHVSCLHYGARRQDEQENRASSNREGKQAMESEIDTVDGKS